MKDNTAIYVVLILAMCIYGYTLLDKKSTAPESKP